MNRTSNLYLFSPPEKWRRDPESNYFLVTSWGHSASIWLAGSLNLHGDVLCNAGIDHPIESFYRYPLFQDGKKWLQHFTQELFQFGANNNQVIDPYFNNLGLVTPKFCTRDVSALANFVFEELDLLAKVSGHSFLGNVHGLILPYLANNFNKLPNLFGNRKVPLVNLIRHPISRTESAIKATDFYHLENMKLKVDEYINANLSECLALERKYKVDFGEPRARSSLHVFRQGLQNTVWANEISSFPMVKNILMERLQSDRDYFAFIFALLMNNKIQADKEYLDKVFDPKNLGSGRRGAEKQGTRPLTPRRQYDAWTDFEKAEFGRISYDLKLSEVYAQFPYDFSYVESPQSPKI